MSKSKTFDDRMWEQSLANMNSGSSDYMSGPIDTITISGDITLDISSVGAAQSVYTISSGNDTIDLSSITLNSPNNNHYTWVLEDQIPFENGFPEWEDFRRMCEEYPGMEKAYEHLKVFYKLCKDEWEAKKKGEE